VPGEQAIFLVLSERRWLRCLHFLAAVLIVFLGKGHAALAETAVDQAARIQRQLAGQGALVPAPRPPSGTMPAAPTAAASAAMGRCIDVHHIDVHGVHVLSPGTVTGATAALEGHCLGLGQINDVLKAVTFAYVQRGYVTARAYLPEQDLSKGVLRVSVVEGKLAAITMNGSKTAEASERDAAFVGMVGKPLNLRDVEQGLDQMSRLPGVDARMAIGAGRGPGESVLAVTRKAGPRLYGDAGMDNLGGDSTGDYESHVNFGVIDPLGLNDRLTVGYQRSMTNSPLHVSNKAPYGDSYNAGYEVPWGYWTFGVSAAKLSYVSELQAASGPIPTSGETDTAGLSAARVLARDQVSNTTLTGTLTVTDTKSYILGSRIDVSSYRLAVTRLELAHERQIWGGAGRVALGVSRGLPSLGAFNDASAPEGSPQGQFSKLDLSASFAKKLTLGGIALSYDAAVAAQWSGDRLFSAQQMSLGGPGTVRGLRASVLYGNRAVYLRQNLGVPVVTQARFGSVEVYGALDAGGVQRQTADSIAGGGLAGAALGLRARGGPVRADISYSYIIAHSAGVTLDHNGMIAATLTMTF
jgi:hemolysin activation/secretion protein